ncbi:MAG: glycosyltransferase family 2 protein [Candidatus Woesearchaeota archaeon]
MKLSIIIPVYNEETTIKAIIAKVKEINLNPVFKEVILVDDGSTDGTRNILRQIKDPSIKRYFHSKNRGKGAALRTGFSKSEGDIILIQDADLEYDPANYRSLIKPILEGKTHVVYGSRFMGRKERIFGKDKTLIPHHYIGNKILTFFTSLVYFKKITDMETCYKVMTRKALNSLNDLKSERFEIEPEITAKLIRRGYKILEKPLVNYNPRSFSQGKKINWKDGVVALYYLIKYRFVN